MENGLKRESAKGQSETETTSGYFKQRGFNIKKCFHRPQKDESKRKNTRKERKRVVTQGLVTAEGALLPPKAGEQAMSPVPRSWEEGLHGPTYSKEEMTQYLKKS